jgi:hypothetical protein
MYRSLRSLEVPSLRMHQRQFADARRLCKRPARYLGSCLRRTGGSFGHHSGSLCGVEGRKLCQMAGCSIQLGKRGIERGEIVRVPLLLSLIDAKR